MSNLSWTEPESAANTNYQPVYPYNNITQTEAGHSFEMDDTPTRERIRLQHREGSFIELHPNGDEVHKIYGDGYEIILKNKNVLIKGVCNITIQGDSVLSVEGDAYTNVNGTAYQTVKGNVKQFVEGDCVQSVQGDFDIYCEKDLTISASKVRINSDLDVRGDIGTNQSVSAAGNVTAGASVSAVKSVETTGYITAAGIITGLQVFDLRGSMEKIRQLFNSHRHIAKGSPTSGPDRLKM